MTYKQLKSALSELQFDNSGRIMDDFVIKVTRWNKKDRDVIEIKVRKSVGPVDQKKPRIIEIQID